MARAAITAAAAVLLLFMLTVVLPTLPPRRLWPWPRSVGCQQGQVVVSMATVAQRLAPGGPFPVALRALLQQTAGDCAFIWVFIPEHDRAAAEAAVPALDAAARRAGRQVHLHYVPDRWAGGWRDCLSAHLPARPPARPPACMHVPNLSTAG